MKYMLAQTVEAVPADTLKWVLVTLFGLLAVFATCVAIYNGLRSKHTVEIEPQPVEVRKAPRRYNHEQAEQRHSDTTRRLDAHDAEIEKLWDTTREEDKNIREEHAENIKRISRSLGRIEGKLGIESDDHQI